MPPISVTLFTDPGCPWGYSALPALRVIEWRYGEQLTWRLVMIGLAEEGRQYVERGYSTAGIVRDHIVFRDRFGMPFALIEKARVSGTARACRAVVAARLIEPGSEWRVLRALQIATFTTATVLDDDRQLAAALAAVPEIDAEAIVSRLDDAQVTAAYESDRAEARAAAGSPAQAQGKTAATDGPVRFTAPTVVFAAGDRRLVAGGWQSAQVYDVLVANLDPTLDRRPPPDDPHALLRHFSDGLVTQEVAALLARDNDAPDRTAAEIALLQLVSDGRATRRPLGHDALWRAA